ncbi:MAG TPA: hypothetical protein DD381_06125 [Lentisphaeria bacterium]|nr:MAG: hypothetical protein A2X47_05290 [Lentisphaerae bacterium GWF2_38_69]HBM15903.1 hypothetical protein [Lentisphaeria bacterium]
MESLKVGFRDFYCNNKTRIIIVLFLAFLSAAFDSVVGYSFSFIIDKGILGKNYRFLIIVFTVLIILAILIALSKVVRDYIYLGHCSEILKKIRSKTFEHMQNLSIGFYASTPPGELLSKFSSDLSKVEESMIYAPSYFIIPLINVLTNTILLFVMDIRLALISMLIFPACFLGPLLYGKRAEKINFKRKRAEAKTISNVQTNIASQTVLKAFSLQKLATHYFEKSNDFFFMSMHKSLFLSTFVGRFGEMWLVVLQVLIFAIGSIMTLEGYLQVGQLVAFQALFLGLSYSLTTISSFMPMVLQCKVGMERINGILSEKPVVTDSASSVELLPFAKEISFNNVTFGYTKELINLDNVSFIIPKNSSVAFVGPSGCGKSTILSLIMRFYDTDSGSVAFDGIDIKSVSQASLRKQLGIVLQENILFNVSIMDNIFAANLDASSEDIYKVARQAEIHDFIISLPEGYNTKTGERGGMLSGGQRQRIAIARALLRGGNILILDEATSALDPVSEAAINATLANIAKSGKTIISVTHRLSSAVNMDKIFVMQKGKIVEHGAHQELMQLNGFYRQMWDKQH